MSISISIPSRAPRRSSSLSIAPRRSHNMHAGGFLRLLGWLLNIISTQDATCTNPSTSTQNANKRKNVAHQHTAQKSYHNLS